MGRNVKVEIAGYGVVKVKIPKGIDMELAGDIVQATVVETMNLLLPRSQANRFHPVLGMGGYAVGDQSISSPD